MTTFHTAWQGLVYSFKPEWFTINNNHMSIITWLGYCKYV